MTQDTKYNGWTNYATWRVNLEMFDGHPVDDINGNDDPHDIGQNLRNIAMEYIHEDATGWALGYALSFLADVNWYEIAERMIDDYRQEDAA
jgi:hypothetical protein